MRKITSVIGLTLITILFLSLTSIIFLKNQSDSSLIISYSLSYPNSLSASIFLRNSFEANIPALNQTTRNMIFNFIEENPGIHFRGICNILGLAVGVAQYHLGVLTKAGLIRSFKDGRFKRFLKSKKFSSIELKIISLLRKKTTGTILTTILKKKTVSHQSLKNKTGISSQALSWHIKRLKSIGILDVNNDGLRNDYYFKPEKIEIVEKCQQLINNSL